MEQGKHRLDRGHYFFERCRSTAQRLSMTLKWDLKIAPGVGHSNAGMAAFAEKVLFSPR